MFKHTVFVCCLYFCAFTPYMSYAMTDEQQAQIHAHFEAVGKMCIKDNTITSDDIMKIKAHEVPTGPNAACFIACVMKNIGAMDDKGMVQHESALELAKKVFNDPEELSVIADFLKSCNHVNSAAVSDGEKGCERAILAYKCMNENRLQFGLDI